MNIGIYVASISNQAGGGHTFQETILQSLGKNSSKHEYYIFHYGVKRKSPVANIHFVSLKSPQYFLFFIYWRVIKNIYFLFFKKLFITKYNSLCQAVVANRIDIVWFLTNSFEYVEVPFVFTVWDLQHRLQPFFPEVSIEGWNWQFRENYYRSILPRATFVITGNDAGKKEIMQFYGVDEHRIKIVPHPTPNFVLGSSLIAEKPRFAIPKHFVLYPAQYWPHKNHVMLVEAMKVLREKYSIDVSLICTGSDKGNKSFIEGKIIEAGLDKSIFLKGFVKTEELVYLYKHALALVYPTFFGPENLPPLEAFALGCPVIASDVPGAKEQFGDAAIRMDAVREDQWAHTIFSLFKNMNIRKKLIQRGRKRALRWTSDHFVQKMNTIFDEFSIYRRTWK